MKRRHDDNPELPAVIPKIEVVDGEPVIATRHVVERSPIPRSLAIVLILLAALSVGYTFVQQEQRRDDNQREDQRIAMIIRDLREQDEQSARERERLRAFIVSVFGADTPQERQTLLDAFIEAEASDPAVAPSGGG